VLGVGVGVDATAGAAAGRLPPPPVDAAAMPTPAATTQAVAAAIQRSTAGTRRVCGTEPIRCGEMCLFPTTKGTFHRAVSGPDWS
jgi:hypothetical protein